MSPRLLLDTHILVHWLHTSRRLSREQHRVLREAVKRREPIAVSAMTLLEVAVVFGQGTARGGLKAEDVFAHLAEDPAFQIIPICLDVAAEVAALGRFIGDPSDRAIVATARVHRLRLVTSDQRIIDSGLVPVIA